MSTSQVTSDEGRRVLAGRIVELSDRVLSVKENRQYIGLQVEAGRYKNAVALHGEQVSFYPSEGSLDQARAEGFNPEPVVPDRPGSIAEHKYLFRGLSITDLRAHEALFRAMTKESVDFILSRRPRGK
jgi:hypothetical protein